MEVFLESLGEIQRETMEIWVEIYHWSFQQAIYGTYHLYKAYGNIPRTSGTKQKRYSTSIWGGNSDGPQGAQVAQHL